MFRYFKQRKVLKAQAQGIYKSAMTQARLPVFYKDLAVPDSFDGRFEMLALHCFIVMSRLNKVGHGKLSQAVFDAFFTNMSQSIIEHGVTDIGLPKHMKRMMQGFNGRRKAYEDAIKNNDLDALEQALRRNVYGTISAPMPNEGNIAALARYVEQSITMEMNVENAEFATIDITQEKRHA